jgi:hypothetical protein
MTVREQCISYIQVWCNNPFLDEQGEVSLPPPVVLAVDRMLQGLNNVASGVTSKAVEGAFVSGSDIDKVFAEVKSLCRDFRKVRSL